MILKLRACSMYIMIHHVTRTSSCSNKITIIITIITFWNEFLRFQFLQWPHWTFSDCGQANFFSHLNLEVYSVTSSYLYFQYWSCRALFGSNPGRLRLTMLFYVDYLALGFHRSFLYFSLTILVNKEQALLPFLQQRRNSERGILASTGSHCEVAYVMVPNTVHTDSFTILVSPLFNHMGQQHSPME